MALPFFMKAQLLNNNFMYRTNRTYKWIQPVDHRSARLKQLIHQTRLGSFIIILNYYY